MPGPGSFPGTAGRGGPGWGVGRRAETCLTTATAPARAVGAAEGCRLAGWTATGDVADGELVTDGATCADPEDAMPVGCGADANPVTVSINEQVSAASPTRATAPSVR